MTGRRLGWARRPKRPLRFAYYPETRAFRWLTPCGWTEHPVEELAFLLVLSLDGATLEFDDGLPLTSPVRRGSVLHP